MRALGSWMRRRQSVSGALGVIGAFLGLRPVVRITLAWAVLVVLLRAVRRGEKFNFGVVAPLWPLVLLHIVLWKHVSPLLNW